MKKTLAIDFDGTLSAYTGWKGETAPLDPPLPGAVDFLNECLDHGFKVTIFTTRPIQLVDEWLDQYAGPDVANVVEITNLKPPAWLYIDDRCFLFTGTFPSMEEIDKFKAWWQK
jgi:hypothetical protein